MLEKHEDIKEEENFESGESRPKRKVSKEGAAISDDINLHWIGMEAKESVSILINVIKKKQLLIF